MDPKRILILSGYDDAMREVGDRCTATHKRYAELHGYDHEVVREYRKDTHPSHQKIRLIRERIDRYDRIMWLDADSVVMRNDSRTYWTEVRPAECSIDGVMMISVDWCAPVEDDDEESENTYTTTYVSCGNFVIANTPDTHRFLETWAKYSERYAKRQVCCWEQDGLRAAMQADSWFNERVERIHRRCLNAVHPTCTNRNFPDRAPKPYEPGCFLLHLTNVDRIAILNELGL
jgi:hypothetical protein